jgi:hypothetical protein
MSWKRLPILSVLVGLAACGTPKNTAELKIRVSESHLAPVPMEQRQNVAEAEQAVFLAQWQIQYTEAELGIAKTDVDVAKNEIEQAKLSAKTADTRQAHATKTADQDLIKEAAQLEKVAALEISVAEQALAKAKQRVEYLEARLEAERLIHRREEARTEYAKAQSMAAAGVKPPDFQVKKYQTQYQERQRLASSAMARADQKKKALAGIEQKLSAARAQLEQAQKPNAELPLEDPSKSPAGAPTLAPVGQPTEGTEDGTPPAGEPPTGAPADAPTGAPADAPTGAPADAPTGAPTDTPDETPAAPTDDAADDDSADGDAADDDDSLTPSEPEAAPVGDDTTEAPEQDQEELR